MAYLGHFSCCNADTWASELGILATRAPILITTCRKVPPGTNGGITLTGLLASAAGGLFIGLVFWGCGCLTVSESVNTTAPDQKIILPLSLFAGLFGSLLDSLLGALLQASVYDNTSKKVLITPTRTQDVKHISGVDILDNHQVLLFRLFLI